MSIRYSIDKGFVDGQSLVYDNVTENYVFRGTYEECHDWIDDPMKLALKEGETVNKALENSK